MARNDALNSAVFVYFNESRSYRACVEFAIGEKYVVMSVVNASNDTLRALLVVKVGSCVTHSNAFFFSSAMANTVRSLP